MSDENNRRALREQASADLNEAVPVDIEPEDIVWVGEDGDDNE